MKKYIIYQSHVRSINDGDLHFISYGQLINLYHLRFNECLNRQSMRDTDPRLKDEKYIQLSPRLNGDYKEHLQTLLNEVNSNTSQTKHL